MILQNEFENFLSADYKSAISVAANIAETCSIQIYLIGGIVRDLIMQNPIKDIDITVQGNAVEFAKNLEQTDNFKIVAIQENLKTAKVQYINGVEIDFASTREEEYPIAGNLPVIKNFGCELECDVKRRDFTINTLAISLTGNNKFQLIDFYSGFNDIKNKKIKVLHDKSFIDDPSRIVRALKFMLRFNFSLDENTEFLMDEYFKNVNKTMPLERVKSEFKQLFSVINENIYENVINLGIYRLISDNAILNINIDYFNEILNFNFIDINDKWFIYFLLLIFKSDFAIERLNLTADERKSVYDLRELYFSKIKDDSYTIYKSFKDKNNNSIAAYYAITGSKYVIKYLQELKNIKIETDGNDLINMGFQPSPMFGEILDCILKEKLNGNLKTKKEETEFVLTTYKKDES